MIYCNDENIFVGFINRKNPRERATPLTIQWTSIYLLNARCCSALLGLLFIPALFKCLCREHERRKKQRIAVWWWLEAWADEHINWLRAQNCRNVTLYGTRACGSLFTACQIIGKIGDVCMLSSSTSIKNLIECLGADFSFCFIDSLSFFVFTFCFVFEESNFCHQYDPQ